MGNLLSSNSPIPGDGLVVLITGCSKGGIGYSLAEEFKGRGATVYATSRNVSTMEGLGEQGIRTVALDVTSQESVNKAVAEVATAAKRIDILVNNAGIGGQGPVVDTPIEQWKKFYDTNVFGTVAMSQAVFPHMAENRWGRILNIGSVAGVCHRPWSSVYSSSKAAVHCITNIMRMEMKPFGISVIAVIPGYIKTNIFSNALGLTITPPADSPYSVFAPTYKERYLHNMGDPKNMPAEEFAKKVADEALRPNPRWRIVLGHMSFVAFLVSYLPTQLTDGLFWSHYAKDKVADGGKHE